MQRSIPTPIRNTPSSAPLEVMAAKQQTHIEELVTKNRSLEQNIAKLQSELSAEKARYEDGLYKVRVQYDTELKQWKEHQEMQTSLWRISYMRLSVKVETERKNVLDIQNELRLTRLAIVQRDYRLEMFAQKEADQEDRITELEQELDGTRFEAEETQLLLHALEKQVAQLVEQEYRVAEELREAVEERDQLESTLQGLRKENAILQSSSSSSSSSMQRVKLELEGVQASFNELRTKHTELECERVDLVRQLEKWRTMDSRDGAELETLRKRTVELEVEIEKLQETAERREQKFETKLQKYRDSLSEHKAAYDECVAEADEKGTEIEELRSQLKQKDIDLQRIRDSTIQPENEAAALRKQLAEKNRKIEQLQARLDASTQHGLVQRNASYVDTVSIPDEEEDVMMREPSPEPGPSQNKSHGKPKPKPRPRPRTDAATQLDAQTNSEILTSQLHEDPSGKQTPKPKPRPRPRVKQPVQPQDASGDSIQEIDPPPNVVFSAGKKKHKPQEQSLEENASSDIEVTEVPSGSLLRDVEPSRGKGKQKEKGDADTDKGKERGKKSKRSGKAGEDVESMPQRRIGKAKASANDEPPASPSSRKGKRRAVNSESEQGEEHQQEPTQRPKKKGRRGVEVEEEENERPAKLTKSKEKAKDKRKDKGKKTPLFLNSSESEDAEKAKGKEPEKKKAKRKIGLGLSSGVGPPKLTFSFSNGDKGDKGMNIEIPTELESPTKDAALSPRAASALGKSTLKKGSMFGGRR